jgi:alpha-amylase
MNLRALAVAMATFVILTLGETASAQANLALGKFMSASSSNASFPPGNSNDGNAGTYWEGAANTYPNTLTVALGANYAIARVVVKLNATWGTRTQTIQVLGHNLSTTTFTSLVSAATYTFNPTSANTVTIPVTATVSDVRLTFTANSGAVAGQVAEIEVYGGTATPTATSRSVATPTVRPRATATATPRAGATAVPIPPAQAGPDSGSMVHLFSWRWPDVALECERFLGPRGYKAVQVSPPNEHVNDARWWSRYQPVSYRVESHSGTRAQFSDMVNRCRAVGIDVYADVVFNHTASLNGGGTGNAGTVWSLKSHPMFSSPDYHNLTCSIDYNNASTVQNCDLVGLPDLNTGSTYVRQTQANYANDLLALGVAGFRVDAAKHVSPADLSNIYSRFSRSSFIYQEVIDNGSEAVKKTQYSPMGYVEEFQYSIQLATHFKGGQIRNLRTFASTGFLPSNRAISFTDNHDNQRGHSIPSNPVNFKDGSLYDLANVFQLAWPYGYPRIMSSYNFSNTDQGPPATNVHNGTTLNCFGSTWVCEHRWRSIANMVVFRRVASGAAVANWWDNGLNQIAFARAGRGFVVINRQSTALTQTFTTGLPAGSYCNVIDFDWTNGACSGAMATVNASGQMTLTVPGMRAAAFHVSARR